MAVLTVQRSRDDRRSTSIFVRLIPIGYKFGRALMPKPTKPLRCQLSVSNGVLNTLVPKVVLNGPRIDPFVGQGKPAGMPQHVRMNRELQSG